jgi:hypothetical protein
MSTREPDGWTDARLGYFDPEPDDPLWRLSFRDGIVIVQAPTIAAAITRSHVLRVNPGGEVKVTYIGPSLYVDKRWRDRLLDAGEVEEIEGPGELREAG